MSGHHRQPLEPDLKERIIAALRTVHDPEIPVNVYDLGLIYSIDVRDDGAATVTMTLTAPNCPMADVIVGQVETRVRDVAGCSSVEVELVWEPAWTPEMMSEAAKLELEFTGHTGPAHLRPGRRFAPLSIRRTPPPRPDQ